MDFLTKWGVFNTRLARPEKGGLRGTLTEEELEKVLSTYVKGRLSPGPDGVITELLKDTTCTERKVILLWINGVLTSEKPGLRLSVKEVHGLVALLHKGGGSTDRASDYRPVVLGPTQQPVSSNLLHYPRTIGKDCGRVKHLGTGSRGVQGKKGM